jgi:hypothetical protein
VAAAVGFDALAGSGCGGLGQADAGLFAICKLDADRLKRALDDIQRGATVTRAGTTRCVGTGCGRSPECRSLEIRQERLRTFLQFLQCRVQTGKHLLSPFRVHSLFALRDVHRFEFVV